MEKTHNLKKSVQSGGYSIPYNNNKSSPMYAKRRSKNERKMVTGISNNIDYKNPYCPENEGPEDEADYIEKIKYSNHLNFKLKINLRDSDLN